MLTVRTAQGAIAWATSLVFMPYLTLLPYLVFGRSRFDAASKIASLTAMPLRRAALAKLMSTMESLTTTPDRPTMP